MINHGNIIFTNTENPRNALIKSAVEKPKDLNGRLVKPAGANLVICCPTLLGMDGCPKGSVKFFFFVFLKVLPAQTKILKQIFVG